MDLQGILEILQIFVSLCADFKRLLVQGLAATVPFQGLSPFQKGGSKKIKVQALAFVSSVDSLGTEATGALLGKGEMDQCGVLWAKQGLPIQLHCADPGERLPLAERI